MTAKRSPRKATPRAGIIEFPLDASIGAVIRFTHRAYAQDLQSYLASHDIPVGMWFFLRALWEEDGLTQRELSRRVGSMEPTTVQQLHNMERRGLIERRRSATDARKSHVHLTAEGRALRSRLLPYAVEVNSAALTGFSAAEIRSLRDLLARIRSNLERRLDESAAAAVDPARKPRRRASKSTEEK